MTKLNKTFIDDVPIPDPKPDGGATQVLYRDSSLLGFGLRVGSGGTKTFFVERRINGRVKRISIGRYGHLTPSQARTRAQEVLGSIVLGGDPTEKKPVITAKIITLQQAFDDFASSRKDLKESSLKCYRASLQANLSDWLNKRLIDITRDMVEKRHLEIGRKAPVSANNTMQILQIIFNYVIAKYEDDSGKSFLSVNPVDRLSKLRAWYKVEPRRSYLAPNELGAWYRAVKQLSSEVTQAYLFFLLFTGLRKMEAAKLRWSDIDFDSRVFTVQDTKNGRSHTLPITDYLMELLTSRLKDSHESEWVFYSPISGIHIKQPSNSLKKIQAITGKHFMMHDLRRTFITIAESLDIPAYALKNLLNHHNPNDVTAGYIISGVDRLRVPMQRITDFIIGEIGE